MSTAQSSSSSQKTYTITFVASGLPSGHGWGVHLSGKLFKQYTSTSEPGGNQITYTVYAPGVYYYVVSSNVHYLPSVGTGAVVVGDSNPDVVVPIQFYSANMPTPTSTGTVTFNVSGLPSDFQWKITIGAGIQWYDLNGKGNQTVSIKLPSPYLYEYEFVAAMNCPAPSIQSGYVMLTDQEPNVTINIQCLQFVNELAGIKDVIIRDVGVYWLDILILLVVLKVATIPAAALGWHKRRSSKSGNSSSNKT